MTAEHVSGAQPGGTATGVVCGAWAGGGLVYKFTGLKNSPMTISAEKQGIVTAPVRYVWRVAGPGSTAARCANMLGRDTKA